MKLFSLGSRVLNADLIASFRINSVGDNQFELIAEMQNGNSFSTDFNTIEQLESELASIAISLSSDAEGSECYNHVEFMRMFQRKFTDRSIDLEKWSYFFS